MLAPLARERWAVAACAALVVAGGLGLARRRCRPSGAELDRLRNADLGTLALAHALRAWGIASEELVGTPPHVHVYAPLLDESAAQSSRAGRDGIVRFNPVHFAIIGFGRRELFAYVGVLDLLTGAVRGEQSERYPYRQLADVTTRVCSRRATCRGESRRFDDAEVLVVRGTVGAAVRLPIRSAEWARLLGGELPSDVSDRALSVVRSTVARRKRSATEVARDAATLARDAERC